MAIRRLPRRQLPICTICHGRVKFVHAKYLSVEEVTFRCWRRQPELNFRALNGILPIRPPHDVENLPSATPTISAVVSAYSECRTPALFRVVGRARLVPLCSAAKIQVGPHLVEQASLKKPLAALAVVYGVVVRFPNVHVTPFGVAQESL